ncbi:MAG: hypothetical protein IJP75_06455 [Bacteroidaceae bacterium]|nr:hypothetical protein [Bacteroidaceae bacterium]
MKKKTLITMLLALVAMTSAHAQCQYCNTYEDFLAGRWQPLDTVYCDTHSKSEKILLGINDFTLTTGDKTLDKNLKKEALIVKQADTLYVNCRNLRFEKTSFGNGYIKARRLGQKELLIVNKIIGMDVSATAAVSSLVLGSIGSAWTASEQMKQQVCYVISNGANEKGRIDIRLIDDELMEQLVGKRKDLHDAYFAEENDTKRRLAAHIVPILEKAGLLKQGK